MTSTPALDPASLRRQKTVPTPEDDPFAQSPASESDDPIGLATLPTDLLIEITVSLEWNDILRVRQVSISPR